MTLPLIPRLRCRIIGWQVDFDEHFAVLEVDRNDFCQHQTVEYFLGFDAMLCEIHVYGPRGAMTIHKVGNCWHADVFDREFATELFGISPPARKAPLRARRIDFDCSARRAVIAMARANLGSLDAVLSAIVASGMRPATIELETDLIGIGEK